MRKSEEVDLITVSQRARWEGGQVVVHNAIIYVTRSLNKKVRRVQVQSRVTRS